MKRVTTGFLCFVLLLSTIYLPRYAASAQSTNTNALTYVVKGEKKTSEYKDKDGTVICEAVTVTPVLSLVGGKSNRVSQSVNKYFADIIEAFVDSAYSDDGKSYVEFKYRLTFLNTKYLALVCDYYFSPYGVAYPSSWVTGHIFDLSTGKLLALSDFFTDTRAVLTLAYEKLERSYSDIMFDQTLNDYINYFEDSDFVLTDKGFAFYCEVIHAAGDFISVGLSFNTLSDYMKISSFENMAAQDLAPIPATKEDIYLNIHQVDTSLFPQISLYFSALNEQGIPITGLTADAFKIIESGNNPVVPESFSSSLEHIPLSVSLILDTSGSMDGNPLKQAKTSAKQFLDYVDFKNGDTVEIMEFNDSVYVHVPFSSSVNILSSVIGSIQSDGQTALYDALYTGLVRAYAQIGPKCILAFTDGEENASSYSFDDVVTLSQSTAIPVFLIGVGDAINEQVLQNLASMTGGRYYYAPSASDLEQIYRSVYEEQKDQYVLTFQSGETESLSDWHDITLVCENNSYSGTTQREYVPNPDSNLPLEYLYFSVTASSILPPQSDAENPYIDYLPYHAFDGKPKTAWVENAKGDGIDEWLRIDFVRPVTLSGLYIQNGYWKSELRLGQNNRLKRVRIEYDDGYEEFDLTDTAKENFGQLVLTKGQRLDFSAAQRTTYVKIIIQDVYKGNKWRDTCISGVELFR